MHGKIIKFKGDISDFKVKDGIVKIQLAADTQDVVLDQLNEPNCYQRRLIKNADS